MRFGRSSDGPHHAREAANLPSAGLPSGSCEGRLGRWWAAELQRWAKRPTQTTEEPGLPVHGAVIASRRT